MDDAWAWERAGMGLRPFSLFVLLFAVAFFVVFEISYVCFNYSYSF